ncbi:MULTISPECIES: hypothetical protein [unclassified Pseudomonas]|uniref:hypothetical protein n=1 Tax=unclassified Pseudomonas TaxID=196821 RepID=UPI0011AF9035|nr:MULTISPECIES: hypothetical protein [unclassified Pseudomonas]
MSNNNILVYDAPKIEGMSDNDVLIPSDLLKNGMNVVIPVWPQQSPNGQKDTLNVRLTRNGIEEFKSTTQYTTPITLPEIIIHIGSEYLVNDGDVVLLYDTLNYLNNPHPSLPRPLTIDHTPVPVDLVRPGFPKANIWGEFNCYTQPAIWFGVEVKVPPLPTFSKIGDTCTVEWFGYLSPNASGTVIPGTYKKIDKPILTNQEIALGFSVTVEPYVPHIEPMEKNASAMARYSIYRGSKLIGSSLDGVVKIDRYPAGSNQPCGP